MFLRDGNLLQVLRNIDSDLYIRLMELTAGESSQTISSRISKETATLSRLKWSSILAISIVVISTYISNNVTDPNIYLLLRVLGGISILIGVYFVRKYWLQESIVSDITPCHLSNPSMVDVSRLISSSALCQQWVTSSSSQNFPLLNIDLTILRKLSTYTTSES